MDIQTGSRTDKGQRRPDNEDRVLARCFANGSSGAGPDCLLAVADGMGGVRGGGLASEIAISTLDALGTQIRQDPLSRLAQLYRDANAAIRRASENDPEYANMGTTLVTALVEDGELWVANVGDSRAYLVRDGELRQLTEDHSLVAELVKAGQITREEAGRSPRRNIITRCLGTAPEVEADVTRFGSLFPGDVLILCSDGLYTLVPPFDLLRIAAEQAPQTAAAALVDLANQRGGTDNIAVVVARMGNGAT